MKAVTIKQKEAVKAIEDFVGYAPEFKGDIDNYTDVSDYLSRWYPFLCQNDWALINGY